jgi:hypothetical protein
MPAWPNRRVLDLAVPDLAVLALAVLNLAVPDLAVLNLAVLNLAVLNVAEMRQLCGTFHIARTPLGDPSIRQALHAQ